MGKILCTLPITFELTAVEIAAVYENRWQIETFFNPNRYRNPLLTSLEIMTMQLKHKPKPLLKKKHPLLFKLNLKCSTSKLHSYKLSFFVRLSDNNNY